MSLSRTVHIASRVDRRESALGLPASGTHAPRVALIHALAHSVAPINAALAAAWPEAVRMNLLDDSLSADLARAGKLDDAMHDRFSRLAQYAVDCGSHAILFTCSAFGPCIKAVARAHPGIPVFKPNEAMIADAVKLMADQPADARLGLLSTFGPTLQTMPSEFPHTVVLKCKLVDGALAALDGGDVHTHDNLIAQAAIELADEGCTALALAQFSMARAAAMASQASGLPVLTTPDSAVIALKLALEAPTSPPPVHS